MLQPKTHFEQVPLGIVRKIVEEQIRRETTTEQNHGTKKKELEEDLLGGQKELMAMSRTFSQVEVLLESMNPNNKNAGPA
jgi:hypothetical protein